MGEPEVQAFLTWLAVEKKVAKSTQNQAFNALFFLYREVLKCPLEGCIDAVRSFKKQRLPDRYEQRGDSTSVKCHERYNPAYGQAALWKRD